MHAEQAQTGKSSLTFDEILQVIEAAPAIDQQEDINAVLTGTILPDAMKKLMTRIAVIQEKEKPTIARPRVALFAGDHAVAIQARENEEQPAFDQIKPMTEGEGPVNRLCFHADAELRVYELDLDNPARDFIKNAPAMTQDEALHAMAYGMMAVEPGVDMLVLGNAGCGHDMAARALMAHFHHDITVEDWLVAFQSPEAVLVDKDMSPFEAFCHYGSLPMAACMGAVLAARLARVPVLVDSESMIAVLITLQQLRSDVTNHCFVVDSDTQSWKKIFPSLFLPSYVQAINGCGSPHNALMTLSLWQNYKALMPASHGVNVHMPA